jgi:hypothetical protein
MTIEEILWALTLAVAVLVVLPILVHLLHRALVAARNIERYTADALAAGVGIAKNTEAVAALRETIRVAGALLEGAGAIDKHTAAIAARLGAKRGAIR